MIISRSIIKKYTPPTCTLKVMGKRSVLSQWSKHPLLKDVRFELRFDDPRKTKEQKITLQGDQLQLEALCEVVNDYVQDFLQQSALSVKSAKTSNWELNAQNSTSVTETPAPPGLAVVSETPHLQTQGLLSHQLSFGNLANQVSGSKIYLSALQLFDLATALEEYSTEMEALPSLNPDENRSQQPTWAGMAAAVLLAVGLTTAVLKLTNQVQFSAQSEAIKDEVALTEPESTPVQPEIPLVPEPPEIALPPSPILPAPLASTETLPPPPRVGTPPPPPPKTEILIQPEIPISPSVSPTPSVSSVSSAASASRSSRPPSTIPPAPKVTTQIEKTNESESENALASLPKEDKSNLSALPPPSEELPSPEIQNLPSEAPKLPKLPSLSASAPDVTSSGSSSVIPDATVSIAAQNRALESKAAPSPETAVLSPNLPPELPQVDQIKQYFQERWQPPENLDQPIEYRLFLNRDGSIQRVAPLGRISSNYIDRTSMPLAGEPFVDPLETEGTPQIRVVFDADGSVFSFLEAID